MLHQEHLTHLLRCYKIWLIDHKPSKHLNDLLEYTESREAWMTRKWESYGMPLGSILVAIWRWEEVLIYPGSASSRSLPLKSGWRYFCHHPGSYKWRATGQSAKKPRLPHPERVPQGGQPQNCHLLPPGIRKWSPPLCCIGSDRWGSSHQNEPDRGVLVCQHAQGRHRARNKQNHKIHCWQVAIGTSLLIQGGTISL